MLSFRRSRQLRDAGDEHAVSTHTRIAFETYSLVEDNGVSGLLTNKPPDVLALLQLQQRSAHPRRVVAVEYPLDGEHAAPQPLVVHVHAVRGVEVPAVLLLGRLARVLAGGGQEGWRVRGGGCGGRGGVLMWLLVLVLVDRRLRLRRRGRARRDCVLVVACAARAGVGRDCRACAARRAPGALRGGHDDEGGHGGDAVGEGKVSVFAFSSREA